MAMNMMNYLMLKMSGKNDMDAMLYSMMGKTGVMMALLMPSTSLTGSGVTSLSTTSGTSSSILLPLMLMSQKSGGSRRRSRYPRTRVIYRHSGPRRY